MFRVEGRSSMPRDQKVGLALGVLLVGAVAALFFRNEPPARSGAPQLRNAAAIAAEIAEKDASPYLPDAASNMGAVREGVGLYVIEDLLDDADLFRRLRLRGEARGTDGLPDLLAALRLVRGTPYADRNRYTRPWLTERRPDIHLQTAVVDVAHLVTSIALKAGDLHQARAAAELALLIAPDETTPALDLANVAIEQGREDEAATLIRTINTWTDQTGEPPLELPERADRILRTHRWLEPAERAG